MHFLPDIVLFRVSRPCHAPNRQFLLIVQVATRMSLGSWGGCEFDGRFCDMNVAMQCVACTEMWPVPNSPRLARSYVGLRGDGGELRGPKAELLMHWYCGYLL